MKISWIEPGVLAASSIPATEQNIRSLHAQGIRAILSLTERPLSVFKDMTPALFAELDITYFHAPVPDQQPPGMAQAHQILRFLGQMKAEGRATFVHCQAGVGRSGTILHLYYLEQGLTLEEARKQVQLRRVQCILLSKEQRDFLKHFAADLPKRKAVLSALARGARRGDTHTES